MQGHAGWTIIDLVTASEKYGESAGLGRPQRVRTERGLLLVCVIGLLALCGCVFGEREMSGATTPPFVESGDLGEIDQRGVLRVLMPLGSDGRPPRSGHPLDQERVLIESFARERGLQPHWVWVASRAELIPALLEGKGDVVAANLTTTRERNRQVAFTVPVKFARGQIVTRAGDRLTEPADLEGRRVAVRRSSSFWEPLQELRQDYPGIEVQELPDDLDTETALLAVAERRQDVALADSNVIEAVLSHRKGLQVAFDVTEDRPIAWAVRPESTGLLRSLNFFLQNTHLAEGRTRPSHTGDLPEILKRGELRILTRNSAATCFLWRGELMGFQYELARRFAEEYGLRVEVVVPPRGDQLIPWLLEGKGDIVAAALTPDEEQLLRGVAFSRPYLHASLVVVGRAGEPGLDDPTRLGDRDLYVRASTQSWKKLQELRASGIDLRIHAAPEDFEAEEIIDHVARGSYDLTVAYSNVVDIELTWRDDIVSAFPIGDPLPLSWAVRASSPALLREVDAFFEREYRGEFYNVIYRRYFEDPRRIRRQIESRAPTGLRLSPYDDIVKRYAAIYGFDWRMIVAQMYEESRFDPEARSFAGAVGLMQVLPRTVTPFGFSDITHPESNIHAGVRYLAWMRDRFEADLPVTERMWFTLAGYNVGQGHVSDAREIARREGLDPDVWFDNVERAMPLLARAEYARHAKHGYCRGSEPVSYVRDILNRYNAYIEVPDAARQELVARRGVL